MTFVVGKDCINCKHTTCVQVCPVDCFYEGKNILVIDPEECIDCGLCEPECPVDAIFAEDEVPADQLDFIEINEKYFDFPVGRLPLYNQKEFTKIFGSQSEYSKNPSERDINLSASFQAKLSECFLKYVKNLSS